MSRIGPPQPVRAIPINGINRVEVVTPYPALEIVDGVYNTLKPLYTAYYNKSDASYLKITKYEEENILPYKPCMNISFISDSSIIPYFAPFTIVVNNYTISSDTIFESLAIGADHHKIQLLHYYINKINYNILTERSKEKHIKYIEKVITIILYYHNNIPTLPFTAPLGEDIMELYSEVNYLEDEQLWTRTQGGGGINMTVSAIINPLKNMSSWVARQWRRRRGVKNNRVVPIISENDSSNENTEVELWGGGSAAGAAARV